MIDLIKRLEAATEGSRDLDVELAAALGLRYGEYRSHRTNVTQPGCNWTRSLDAALTLVPKGWYGEIRWWGDRSDAAAAAYVGPTSDRRFKGIAETMPLALCIAALKARNEGEERA